jgi:hypothetical protein
MKKTTLVFPTVQALWQFKASIQTNNVEIIISTKTLICECTERNVDLAISKFGAEVFEDDTSQYA